MVRFSCLKAHILGDKQKKAAEPSTEAMKKSLEDSSLTRAPKGSSEARNLIIPSPKAQKSPQNNDAAKDVASLASTEISWKSAEIKVEMNMKCEKGVNSAQFLRKSQSLGSGLCHKGRTDHENDTEEDLDHEYYSDSVDHNGLISEHQKGLPSDSVQVSSDLVNKESTFSFDDLQHSEKEDPEHSGVLSSGEVVNDFGYRTPCITTRFVKSHSLPNLASLVGPSGGRSSINFASRCRTFEDLHVLDARLEDISELQVESQTTTKQDHHDHVTDKSGENYFDDGYDSYHYSPLAKDWVMPATDTVNSGKNILGEASIQQWDEMPATDFKFKRIQEWVKDLEHCGPVEETYEYSETDGTPEIDSNNLNELSSAKVDRKIIPGMEAAKTYLTSLSISATTAQLSNHGLAVIPFLPTFGSLKLLNLSGNSIVRITAGALPRGLHTLILSKNKISAIEGLRELTRLRVLDLSYNRIIRIGHGLASCSSLKELYLAGNKISEVEGFHRLLKLVVLDLRFNKISTTKCLGQLAANYNSLQAISLEGNPAQKNVGDEQLKKYLQGLLPHLVYFNRKAIKASTLKDAPDRAVRLGMSGHQFDHGLRTDIKAARKASQGLPGAKSSSSLIHLRKSQPVMSPKRSKSRQGHLPPIGAKAAVNHHSHYLDLNSKLLNYRTELAGRRSRSEGTLAAF